ncbi:MULTISPECIES: hypothetical protein [unclassified Nocardia]|uniref:hypothetical protein n=1 Tax=Nocardia sp. NPDC060220 TaxID=3347076 RepID=UPI00365412F8
MSDQETGPGFARGPGNSRFDAVERLRQKLAETRAAETGPRQGGDAPSNVVRLPKPPRRRQEDIGAAPRWSPVPDGAYDPAATRPVTRAELQRESGSLPVNDVTQAGAESGANAERDANLIDFDASRRKRVGGENRPGGGRRMVRPRRIGPTRSDGGDAGPSRPDEPGR